MALHTKKNYARLCGIESKALSVYIARQKIILSGDYVDDDIQINKEFLQKRQESKNAQESKPGNIQDPQYPTPSIPRTGSGKGENEKGSRSELEKKKISLEIDKKQEEIDLLRIKKDKLNGQVIPTELVKVIFRQHSQSIIHEFKNAADNIITEISKKKDLNVLEVADLRGRLVSIINEATERSVNQSKKQIQNIINEYVEKREQGERH